jgi:hypothetical protein
MRQDEEGGGEESSTGVIKESPKMDRSYRHTNKRTVAASPIRVSTLSFRRPGAIWLRSNETATLYIIRWI